MSNASSWTQINGYTVAEVSKDCWLQVRANDYCGCIIFDGTEYNVGDSSQFSKDRIIICDSAIKYANGSVHIIPMKKGDKFYTSTQNSTEVIPDICYYREIPFRL